MFELSNMRIGSYRLIGQLDHGGMGIVYHAEHVDTGEEVAHKTVHVPEEVYFEGIRREIRGLVRINHPNIIKVLDEGVFDGFPWYAMELLRGGTLRQHFFSGECSGSRHSFDGNEPANSATGELDFQTADGLWWTETLDSLSSEVDISDGTPHQTNRESHSGESHVETDIKKVVLLIRQLCQPLHNCFVNISADILRAILFSFRNICIQQLSMIYCSVIALVTGK